MMRKNSTLLRVAFLTICAVCFIGVSTASANKWFYGLGTGFKFANAEGDQGFATTLFGPIQAEIDLDPSDFQDLMETGFGLGGYATDGTWLIKASFGKIKLGGEPAGSVPASAGGGTFISDLFFEMSGAEVTVGYTAYRSVDRKFSFTPFAGVRNTKHELGFDISITQGATTTPFLLAFDHSWTDFLIGSSVGYALSPKLNWSAGVDAGFGGSEGTYSFRTGLSWKAMKHVSLGPNFSYSAVEFMNGDPGDSDWYLYDVNEFGVGIGLLINF